MKIAVLGSGAREHALVWRFAAELGPAAVCSWPPRPWVPGALECTEQELPGALRARGVTLVVIGPEALLARDWATELRAAGFSVLGPGAAEARLETSKGFAKHFMKRHGVATAASEPFPSPSAAAPAARARLRSEGAVVLKLDGLAAGKGVFVCESEAELDAALARLEQGWGAAAAVLVEERLVGRELSLLALVACDRAQLFAPIEDHKALEEGDRGPMTGGMGASAPSPLDTPQVRSALLDAIVTPTLRGLRAELPDYRGVLYCGVMLTASGPKLLEYNVRFGDPEAQVLALGASGSLSALCAATARGELSTGWVPMRGAVVCVVLAAPGYPERATADLALAGDLRPSSASELELVCFHAGIKRDDAGRPVTTGGRALSVVARAADLERARAACYDRASTFPNLIWRRDIGARALA